jgi:predicted pyridoxine 5'-phosphate oxidase superfamily flavin-nucleotide-binding protein
MAHQFSAIMFTDGVKAAQAEFGSREKQAVFSERAPVNDALTAREAAFIAQRDTFYMATVNTDGWPYVQHRGGPPGFLRVLGPRQLAYADFRGNTQLVSMGNSRNNNRVSLILMDYPNRRRLKILGHLRYEDARDCLPEQLAAVALDGLRRKPAALDGMQSAHAPSGAARFARLTQPGAAGRLRLLQGADRTDRSHRSGGV